MKYRVGIWVCVAAAWAAFAAFTPGSRVFASPSVSQAGSVVPSVAVRSRSVAGAYDRGRLLLRAHQYAAAAKQFQQAIRLHQNIPASYFGLGTAYFGEGRYPQAYDAFRHASDMNPGNAEYVYKAGLGALYADKAHPAIAYATRFIHLRPRLYSGYHLRFLAFNKALMRKNLLPDARQEVKLRPRDADSWNDLGIALGQNAKYVSSISAFSTAISMRANNYEYYVNRAVVENLNKQPGAALQDLRTARRLAPDGSTRSSIDHAIKGLTASMRHHK